MIDRRLRDRYSRQTMFPGIGESGQEKLAGSRVVIIGCGALGCNIATFLVRAGVGSIRIIDRDFIEYHNLQRQVLFDEQDIKAQLPKAIAAERHLRAANSSVEIEGTVADVNYTNIERLCCGADVILDGLDNFETRFLINDVALKHRIPWIYGGAIASNGMTTTIIPGETPCFRCFSSSLPEPGTTPTCETAGVVGTAPAIIGALQATEAIKILTELGMKNLAFHEKELCEYFLKRLPEIEGLTLYGDGSTECMDRLGVFAFNLKEMPYALVSAILSYEAGIGVRHGCFCAHPYVQALLGVGKKDTEKFISQIKQNYRAELPGAVRISFGFYNTCEEIDYFIEWLKKIARGEHKGEYILDKTWGTYTPKDFDPDFERYFSL